MPTLHQPQALPDPAPAFRDPPPASAEALPVLCSVALLKLRRLMRAEGHDIDVQRMCLDADYAATQLAAAHTSSDAQLRATALALFEQYGRNRAAQLH